MTYSQSALFPFTFLFIDLTHNTLILAFADKQLCDNFPPDIKKSLVNKINRIFRTIFISSQYLKGNFIGSAYVFLCGTFVFFRQFERRENTVRDYQSAYGCTGKT